MIQLTCAVCAKEISTYIKLPTGRLVKYPVHYFSKEICHVYFWHFEYQNASGVPLDKSQPISESWALPGWLWGTASQTLLSTHETAHNKVKISGNCPFFKHIVGAMRQNVILLKETEKYIFTANYSKTGQLITKYL